MKMKFILQDDKTRAKNYDNERESCKDHEFLFNDHQHVLKKVYHGWISSSSH